MSEFKYTQQPLKAFYIIFFFVTAIFFRIPFWFIRALVPAWRQRPSWTFTRSFQLSITRGTVFFLFDVGPDVLKVLEDDPDPSMDAGSIAASKLGLVWVDGLPSEMIKGEVAKMAEVNGVHPARVPAYWYGNRADDGKHAQKAVDGEKVLYQFHGKCSYASCVFAMLTKTPSTSQVVDMLYVSLSLRTTTFLFIHTDGQWFSERF
jgi:hypothetical protein